MQHIVSSMSIIAAIIKCFEKGKHEWIYSVNNVKRSEACREGN